ARIAVADRDSVVIRMDLAEGEKTVPVSAVIDERGLQRWFDPRHLGEVDVPFYLFFGGRLEVELFEPVAALHHHPGLLGVGGVDKHTLCHSGRTPRRAAAIAPRAVPGAVGGAVLFGREPGRSKIIAARTFHRRRVAKTPGIG